MMMTTTTMTTTTTTTTTTMMMMMTMMVVVVVLNLMCFSSEKHVACSFAPRGRVGLVSGMPSPFVPDCFGRDFLFWGLAPQPSPSSTRPSGARGALLKASSVLNK